MTMSRRRLLVAMPLIAALLAVGVPAAAGCGSDGDSAANGASPSPTAAPSPATTYTKATWYKVVGNPGAFEGEPAELTGKIFTEPEYDPDGVGFQMWADPARSEGNTMVWIADPKLKLTTGDYVRVVGTVGKEFTGENAFGGEVAAATIGADEVKVVTALAAAPLAEQTLTPRKSASQKGITVTVRKVEFAESETRVFVTFSNKSPAKASIYAYSAQAVQGGRVYSPAMGIDEYPEPESELPRGSRTSGVIVFKAMDPDKKTRFIFEGYSQDWTVTLKPFVIVVK